MDLKTASAVAAALCLSGCMTPVDSVPLKFDVHGNELAETDRSKFGIRYYRPVPYLLVIELPANPPTVGSTDQSLSNLDKALAAAAAKGGGGGSAATGAGPGSGGGDASGDGGKGGQTAAPASGATDTSFSATSATYSMKVVYLPDWEYPSLLRFKVGPFGSGSFAPQLQDGWMLTGLNAQADTGAAQVLAALAPLATGGAGSASKVASSASGESLDYRFTKQVVPITPIWGEHVLPPGLYRIGPSGLTPVNYFCKKGVILPPRPDPHGAIVLPEAACASGAPPVG